MKANLKILNYRWIPFFKTKNVKIDIPTSWAEVPKHIFEELYYTLPLMEHKAVQFRILSLFVKPKYHHFISDTEFKTLFWANIQKLKSDLITTTPITYFKHGFKKISFRLFGSDFSLKLPFKNKYYLPEPFLADMTGGEMSAGLKQAIIYFNSEGTAEANLNKAVAIFCRPQKAYWFSFNKKNFKRSEFDHGETNETAETFDTLSVPLKLFIIYYVLGSLEQIKSAPNLKVLFSDMPTPSKNDKQPNEHIKRNPSVWFEFMINLAEAGLAGTFDEVQKSGFIEILILAAKRKRDYLEREAKK